ncbi:MAG: RsmE family RNA methyltransferase [Saprospiraceae bacterium]
MIIFYAKDVDSEFAYLDGDEAKHCSKVLRKRVGDELVCIDGRGNFLKGEIVSIEKTACKILIKETWEQKNKKYNTKIAVSLLKNPSRFEWFVEKAVETGIDEIIPMISDRTEKQSVKIQRLENIVISASKQTLKAKFTKINPVMTFNEIINDTIEGQGIIPHLNEMTEYMGNILKKDHSYTILIGPEGDFTEQEVDFALSSGFVPASLGDNRLRTETAAIVAGEIVNIINNLG